MPQGYSTRVGTKGPRSVEKKFAKQPIKPIKEKLQLAKAAALEKKAAARVSHAKRHAKFADNRKPRIVKPNHPCTCSPPDSGSKATRERTLRNLNGDAKGIKADGHGLRHEGLPGDDGWTTTNGKGLGVFEYPVRNPNHEPDLSTYLQRG
jgi:hypothetical protein